MEVPDHPDIQKLERYGTLWPDEKEATCPVCGECCETIYCDATGFAIGCDQCIFPRDAQEYLEEEMEQGIKEEEE